MNIFVQDSELITLGSQMLRWQAISSVFVGIILICTVLFQATGKIIPSFLLSISRQGVVFLVVLLIFSALFGYNGILMAQAIADVLSAVLAMFLLYRIKLISSIA
jgi:multidrug efflux pump